MRLLAALKRSDEAGANENWRTGRTASTGGDGTRSRILDEAFEKLTDALVEDMLTAPDEDLLSELTGDETQLAAEAREVFVRALKQIGSPTATVVPLRVPSGKRPSDARSIVWSSRVNGPSYFYPFVFSTALAALAIVFCLVQTVPWTAPLIRSASSVYVKPQNTVPILVTKPSIEDLDGTPAVEVDVDQLPVPLEKRFVLQKAPALPLKVLRTDLVKPDQSHASLFK
jgi:hypothetical protein